MFHSTVATLKIIRNRIYCPVKANSILMFVFGFLTAACAELISGTTYLGCDSNISFTSLLLSANPRLKNEVNGGYVYSCSTALNHSVDMFIASEFRNYMCAFTCRNIAIGSPRPFYISLYDFAPAIFSSPLLLNNIDRFVKCDTVRIDCHSPGKLIGDSACDSTHCYLPHVGTAHPEVPPPIGGFLVLQNSLNQWVCVKLDSVMRKDVPPNDTGHYYIAGYRLIWYLQTDYSLNFSDVAGVNNKKINQCFFKEVPESKKSRVYTISGKMVSGMQKSPIRYNGILLIKTDNRIQRVISNYKKW